MTWAELARRRRAPEVLPEPWRRGRRCATCQDANMTDLECYAPGRSGVYTLPVGGYDEWQPWTVGPLECWRRRTVATIRVGEDGAVHREEVDADAE